MEIIIKLDREEPVKVKTSSIYGEMPQFPDMDKIRDKSWAENYIGKLKEKIDMLKMDLQTRDEQIQDLKLENDRLKQREELYQKYLNMFDCYELTCVRCIQYRPGDNVPCKLALPQYRHKLINDLNEKLEAL